MYHHGMRVGAIALCMAVVMAGCLESSVTVCGDGRICPPAQVCTEFGCVVPAQIEVCAGKPDGEVCQPPGDENGQCTRGVCVAVRCGNGLVEMGEACDDGNIDSGDGCSARCDSDESCGNGFVDTAKSEGCDCGSAAFTGVRPSACEGKPNSDAADTVCTTDCRIRGCGDGVLGNLEDCDGNVQPLSACADVGYYAGTLGCLPTCRYDTSACVGRCGDNTRNGSPVEACDGADLGGSDCTTFGYYNAAGLACNAVCGFDVSACTGYCGDGVQSATEDCDGTDFEPGINDCSNLGYYSAGTLACKANCRYELAGCDGICGDDDADTANGEQCDGTDLAGATCTTIGYYQGAVTCLPNCKFDQSACSGQCGDGTKNGSELCDGFDVGGAGCSQYGFYTGALACNGTCDGIVTTGCSQRCGDGTKNGSEVCDGNDLGGLACQAFGWNGGTLSCKSDCSDVIQTSCSGFCGDGSIQGSELCDGANHSGEECRTFGAAGGPLGCSAFCQTTFDRCLWGRWKIEPRQTTNHLWDVAWLGPDDVWVVGDRTALHLTASGWSSVPVPGNPQVWAIWAAASNDLWLVGSIFDVNAGAYRPRVYRGNGTTWTAMDPGTTGEIFDIWGASANDVWVVGNNAMSHWNGTTWTPVVNPDYLNAISGRAANDIWAVGLGATRHYNGTTWTSVTPSGAPIFYDVWVRAADDVWAVGSGGAFQRWKPATGWVTVPQAAINLLAITGIGPNDAWAVGASTTLHFDGVAWTAVAPGVSAQLNGVGGASGDVYAVAYDGTIIHHDGFGFRNDNASAASNQHAVWGTGPTTVWTAGQSGDLWTLTPTGWVEDRQPGFIDYNAIWGTGPGDVYLVGGDTITHYNGSFSTTTFPSTWINDVSGTGTNDVWAVARDGKVLHRNAGGWSQTTQTAQGLEGVFAITPTDVWAVGDSGTILHYTGSWASVPSGTGEYLLGVWASGPRDVYAVGGGGTVRHYDGTMWRAVTVPTSAQLFAVWGFAPDDVWIVGDGGALLHYDGALWSTYEAGTQALLDVWGSSSTNVYVVGANGTVRHLEHALPSIGAGACTAAIPLSCETTVLGGTTASDANDFGSYACGSRPDTGGEVVYLMEAPMTGDVTVTMTPYDGDLDLAMLSACDASFCLDTSQTSALAPETVTFVATKGQPLYIAVDGFAGAVSAFTLDVSCTKQ